MPDLLSLYKSYKNKVPSTGEEESFEPPTAGDLSKLVGESLFRRAIPGLKHTLDVSAIGPKVLGFTVPVLPRLSTLKGASVNSLKNLGGLVGTQLSNAAQALTPGGLKVGMASDEPLQDPASLSEVPANALTRIQRLANAVLLGFPDKLAANINETLPEEAAPIFGTGTGRPRTYDETALAWGGGLGKTILSDILPGSEAAQLLTGETPEGKPLTGEQVGEMLTSGLLKTVPVANAIGGRASTRIFDKPRTLEQTKSIGEINESVRARREYINSVAERRKMEAELSNRYGPELGPEFATIRTEVKKAMPKDLIDKFQLEEGGIFDVPELRAVMGETLQTEVFRRVAERIRKQDVIEIGAKVKKGPTPANQIVAQALREGALEGPFLTDLANRHGIGYQEAATIAADVLERTATHGAKTLQPFSEASQGAFQELAARIVKGDTEAIHQWNVLQKSHKNAEGLAPVTEAHNLFRNVLRLRLAAMLSQPATFERNIYAQGLTGVSQIFDNAVSGSIEAAVGKVKGEGRSLSSYYADSISDFSTFVERVRPSERAQLEAVLDAAPMLKLRLLSASAYEISNNIVGSLIKGGGIKGIPKVIKTAKEAGVPLSDIASSYLTTLTRLQEFEYRRIFFNTRLKGNLERIGIASREIIDGKTGQVLYEGAFEQALKELNKPKLREDVRYALADAEAHALKQTYSYSPESGFGKWVLSTYRKHPILTAVALPFPRFLMNQWRWIMERSPTHFFELFNKEFRDKLYEGAEGGFASRQAARQLGQATTGALMFTSAYALRDSDLAGPKYYQFKADEEKLGKLGIKAKSDQEGFIDIRSAQPFSTIAFMGELVRWAKNTIPIDENNPLNLSPNEWLEATVGVRRISETPVLSITDALRSLRSDDPKTWIKVVATPVGQIAASFATPLRAINDIYGGLSGDKESLTARDTEGQELLGPTAAVIPGIQKSLPPRIDPMTGEPIVSEHPLLRQGIGATLSSMTKFEKLLKEVGVPLNDIAGKRSTPEGSRLVSQTFGELLMQKTKDGRTFGDTITESINSQNLSPKAAQYVIGDLLTTLREIALVKAIALNPKVFVKEDIDTLPPFLRDAVGAKLKQQVDAAPF